MRYYYLSVNHNNSITGLIDTFEEQDGMIQLTQEEYQQAQLYSKFDPNTRAFSELKVVENEQSQEEVWKNQVEQAIGVLAEQVAINTLLQGGNQ